MAVALGLNGARAQEVTAGCPDEANVRADTSGERTQWVVYLGASRSGYVSVRLLTVEDGAREYMLLALFEEERSEPLAASVERLTDHSW